MSKLESTVPYPTVAEVLSAIPKHCFNKSTLTSIKYLTYSVTLSALIPVLAYFTVPLPSSQFSVFWNVGLILAWIAYAVIEGTVATGCWVLAHECGHGAFLDNVYAQDAVGYVLHSALLVPYFSWQRSHAVHHSRTNHLSEGETHVPSISGDPALRLTEAMKNFLGEDAFSIYNVLTHLLVGWPLYLLFGVSGGPIRGITNHFIPTSDSLFPGEWKTKVLISDIGVCITLAALYAWSRIANSWTPVILLYILPYLVVNAWLVGYTWLQHTDVDIPHFDSNEWDWVKGAFATVDRPYGALIDFLHHRIGSTHVAHHLCFRIPHYHALEATNAIKTKFPELYRFDPTPIPTALFRVGAKCVSVHQDPKDHSYKYTAPSNNTDTNCSRH